MKISSLAEHVTQCNGYSYQPQLFSHFSYKEEIIQNNKGRNEFLRVGVNANLNAALEAPAFGAILISLEQRWGGKCLFLVFIL